MLYNQPIIINTDIIKTCNFKCSYCCVTNISDTTNTDTEITLNNIVSLKKHIRYISKTKPNQKVDIIFLGGEPLQHSKINQIFKIIFPELTKNITLTIHTNGYYLDKINFKDIKQYQDFIKIQISYHPEYFSPTKFFNLIKTYLKEFKIIPNIMLSPDKNIYKSQELITLFENNNIEFDLNTIHDTSTYKLDPKYQVIVTSIWEKYQTQEDKVKIGNTLYSVNDIFKNKLNNFYGVLCKASSWIFKNNEFINSCSGKSASIREILNMEYINCPVKFCPCDEFFFFDKKFN
jgi:MoaA/NifB/PqqE/SkfB family radical SAM enzyme